MIVAKKDADLFIKLYDSLLLFTNHKKKVVSIEELTNQTRFEIRNVLYEDISIIDSYIKHNPDKFSQEELDIVGGWKNFIFGDMFLLRQLKKYAIFLHSNNKTDQTKAYGVLGLYNTLEELIYPIPVYVSAALLPFKGQIIYDGILGGHNIYFGSNLKKSLNRDYNEAKAKYGIITSFDAPETTLSETDEDINMLRLYLKSKKSMHEYWEEIIDLKYKNDTLETEYYQALGKLAARDKKKNLKELGLKKTFFAIYEFTIVASGKTRAELDKNIKTIIPKDRIKHLYVFQVK